MFKKVQKTIAILMVVAALCGAFGITAYATDDTNTTESLSFDVAGESVTDWDEALEYAADFGVTTITLNADSVLTSGLTIPSGYTLVIPTSADASDTLTGNNASGAVSNLAEGIKLTMTGDASITVNGTLLVAGNQQSTQPQSGCLTGSYGAIDMASGTTITVNSGAKLYARGEISGEGSVVANSGSTVYQLFQILDWRGGTAASTAYGKYVFPFNLYEVNNISVETVYNYGSALIGQSYIYASSTDTTGEVKIIGTGAEFEFAADVTTGAITFSPKSNGRTMVTIDGAVQTGNISVTMNATLWGSIVYTQTFSSAGMDCPFGYSMDVTVADGSSLTVTNSMKILPGCTITVEDGGTLVVASGASLNLYSSDYAGAYNSIGWTSATPASLVIADTATVTNNGTIASSDSSFGNINGYTGADGTATVYEYAPSLSSDAYSVTFYTGAVSAESDEDAVVPADIA